MTNTERLARLICQRRGINPDEPVYVSLEGWVQEWPGPKDSHVPRWTTLRKEAEEMIELVHAAEAPPSVQ